MTWTTARTTDGTPMYETCNLGRVEAVNSADEDGPRAGGRALENLCRAIRRTA